MKAWSKSLAIFYACLVAGCNRPTELSYVSSTQVAKLKPELQETVRSVLKDRSGTPQVPRLIGHSDVSKPYFMACSRGFNHF